MFPTGPKKPKHSQLKQELHWFNSCAGYRVTHQVGNWVGLTDFGYSAVCQILLGQMRVRQKGLSRWAISVEHINQSQTNPVTDLINQPVDDM